MSESGSPVRVDRDLLTVPEVAPTVGVHPETLYRLIRADQFPPAVHIGSRVLISRPKLQRYLHGDAS